MVTFTTLISTVAMFAALMIPGFIMGKARRIENGATVTVGNLLSDIAMPALVFVKLIETDVSSLKITDILISVLLLALTIPVIYFISRLIFKPRDGEREHLSAIFCSMFSNCGFLGIPLAATLFPNKPEVTVFVSLANVTSSFFLLTLGTSVLESGASTNEGKKKNPIVSLLLRPVTFAVVLGTACSLLGVGKIFPQMTTYFGTLSGLTTPLSMTALGYELSKMNLRGLLGDRRVYVTAAIRLLLSPLLALSLLFALRLIPVIEISYELMAAMLITTAVSTAASASAMARAHGIEGSLAASATLVNTLLCVVTLPIIWLLFDAVFI